MTLSSSELPTEELLYFAGVLADGEFTEGEGSVTVPYSENTVTRNLWATDLTGASLYLVDHSEAHGPDGIVLNEAPELVKFTFAQVDGVNVVQWLDDGEQNSAPYQILGDMIQVTEQDGSTTFHKLPVFEEHLGYYSSVSVGSITTPVDPTQVRTQVRTPHLPNLDELWLVFLLA